MPDTSAGCWTMFFKARPPCNESLKTTRVPYHVTLSRAKNRTNKARVTRSKPNTRTSSARRRFRQISVIFRGLERSLASLGMTTPPSDPFFFQVVHVEPVMHHSVTRNEFLNIILHVLLEFQGQVAQMQVAFLVVPGNNFGTRTLFRMIADPFGDFTVGCTGGNERPKIIIRQAFAAGCAEIVFPRADCAPVTSLFRGSYP